jgi:hypothetical protein
MVLDTWSYAAIAHATTSSAAAGIKKGPIVRSEIKVNIPNTTAKVQISVPIIGRLRHFRKNMSSETMATMTSGAHRG